jgi:RNA polymerase sigma-70 factor, ECF subfamily
MLNAVATNKHVDEGAATERFLEAPSEESFTALFKTYTPQLVGFFRARGCESAAEDLAQEVMLTVYRKAGQVRDRALFRAWVFTIARNALCRHWGKCAREVETVDLADVPERLVASNKQLPGSPAFEFHSWIACLDSREKETLTLRFIEEWEYHEIAAAQTIPIGTVQWRVFNAKRKLAPRLKRTESSITRKAA